MCGICGQYNFRTSAPVVRHDVERMTQTIAHRGPDDEGYFVSGSLGLGFRRLSIDHRAVVVLHHYLDLPIDEVADVVGVPAGTVRSRLHHAMPDAEKTVWVVFNGEIYNFHELRQELESRGHRFRTRSDTEVIIHGYKEWSTGVFDRLNGMFAFALWDGPRQRLLLVRDLGSTNGTRVNGQRIRRAALLRRLELDHKPLSGQGGNAGHRGRRPG